MYFCVKNKCNSIIIDMGYLSYNGYKGSVEYNETKKCLYGKVQGITEGTITYKGKSVEELTINFQKAIDAFAEKSKQNCNKSKKKERNEDLRQALLGYYEYFLNGFDSKETYYNQIELIDKKLKSIDGANDVETLVSSAITEFGTKLKEKVVKNIMKMSGRDLDADIVNQIANKISQNKSRKKIQYVVRECIKNEDEIVKEKVLKELDKILNQHYHPLKELMNQFEVELKHTNYCQKSQNNLKSYLKKLSTVALGFYHANTWLQMDDDLFCKLIAKSSLFASVDIVREIQNGLEGTDDNKQNKGNKYASWDYMKRARKIGKERNEQFDDDTNITSILINNEKLKINEKILADDNSYANQFIKKAVLKSYQRKYPQNIIFKNATWEYFNDGDYEACHVWDLPGDRRYYTSIANLVLVPRALAQLTDHNDAVKNLLRYEVQERFGFRPEGVNILSQPSNYNSYVWRDGSTQKSKF